MYKTGFKQYGTLDNVFARNPFQVIKNNNNKLMKTGEGPENQLVNDVKQ